MSNLPPAFTTELADRYRIERELGRGGMATVYLATDLKHERPVALKVLHPDLAHALGPERFLREVKLAARLQHPHILTVHDSGESGGRLWFTMPYVEGESLRDRLTRERQLPVATATRIAREAALALGYAHEQGVLHRDIKPENILLTRDGSTLVADFGIARTLDPKSEPQLTETGLAIGTAGYMSPEQATGEKSIDLRSDLYSLGAVLYEMLAGEPAFTGPTVQAILARVLTQPPRPIAPVRPGVPAALDAVLAKAMAITPADRYGSAADFSQALASSVLAATAAATVATPSAARRRRISPALAMLLLGFTVGAGVLFAWKRRSNAIPATGSRLIAVLPFENIGAPEDAYFADGVTDAVRGKLTGLPGLEIIASNSSGQYRNSLKTARQIGDELGVQYLVIGKVRWSKSGGTSRVQVSPELIQVSTGTSKWNRPFDAALTDVFTVQAEIATQVATALDVALDQGERAHLQAKLTSNIAAYDAFLKAEAGGIAVGRLDVASVRQSVSLYEQAVALDPKFALAWAQLSRSLLNLGAATALTAEISQRTLEASNHAIALAPDQPEGYMSQAVYFRVIHPNLDSARALLAQARRLAPQNANLLRTLGTQARAEGNTSEALSLFQQATRLDPRSVPNLNSLGDVLVELGRFAEADSIVQRSLMLAPDSPNLVQRRVVIRLAAGDLAGAQALLRQVPPSMNRQAVLVNVATFSDLTWVLEPADRQLVLGIGPEAYEGDDASWALVMAQLYDLQRDASRSRAYGDTAQQLFTRQLNAGPDDVQLHLLRGLALAYAGRFPEAEAEAVRSAELQHSQQRTAMQTYVPEVRARIFTRAGKPELALGQLELATSFPGLVTPAYLHLDPTYLSLRGNPRFAKLRAGS